MFKIGDKVKVKDDIEYPSQGWGCVNHNSKGIITHIDTDGHVYIDFYSDDSYSSRIFLGWGGNLSEIELVTDPYQKHINKLMKYSRKYA